MSKNKSGISALFLGKRAVDDGTNSFAFALVAVLILAAILVWAV